MPRNDRTTSRNGVVIDEMTAGRVVKDEAALLEESDYLARFDGRKFWHRYCFIAILAGTKPAVTVASAEMWKTTINPAF